jgi:hypothetical protein
MQQADSIRYTTFFDVTNTTYGNWWFGLVGLVFVGVGILMIRNPGLFRQSPAFVRGFGWFFVVFASLWTIGASMGPYQEYQGLRRAVRDHTYLVVEGIVTDFVPGRSDGHPPESFNVAGHRYSYSPYVVTSGFNQITARGGPIRPGLRVRIADVHGVMARLEVAP